MWNQVDTTVLHGFDILRTFRSCKGLPVMCEGLPVMHRGLPVMHEGLPVMCKGLPVMCHDYNHDSDVITMTS